MHSRGLLKDLQKCPKCRTIFLAWFPEILGTVGIQSTVILVQNYVVTYFNEWLCQTLRLPNCSEYMSILNWTTKSFCCCIFSFICIFYYKRQVSLHLSDALTYTTDVISSLAEVIKIFKTYFSVEFLMITTIICISTKS